MRLWNPSMLTSLSELKLIRFYFVHFLDSSWCLESISDLKRQTSTIRAATAYAIAAALTESNLKRKRKQTNQTYSPLSNNSCQATPNLNQQVWKSDNQNETPFLPMIDGYSVKQKVKMGLEQLRDNRNRLKRRRNLGLRFRDDLAWWLMRQMITW